MATRKHIALTEHYPLKLISYSPDRKAAVIAALQKATEGRGEFTPDGANAFVEGDLPADVDYYDTESARDEARKVLEEAGAVVTVPQSAPNAFEELDAIQEELLALVSHFQLVDQRLYGQLDDVPEEFVPAAMVLHNATTALDALHNRLDRANVRMADVEYGPGWRERLKAETQVTEGVPHA